MQHVGERGRHAKEMRQGSTTIVQHKDGSKTVTHSRPIPGMVSLDPEVRRSFPDAASVNAARRGLMALIPAKRRAARTARPQATEGAEP